MSKPQRNSHIQFIQPTIPPFELPQITGVRYEAEVPDTLDLAERARHAVYHLTAATDPEANAEIYWLAYFGAKPPLMYHDVSDWCEYKYYGPSLLLRQACGYEAGMDVEWHRMANLLQMQGPDGLLYITNVGRPWAKLFDFASESYETELGDHFVAILNLGRMLEAVAAYYAVTADGQWRALGEKVVDSLGQRVTDRGDFAYFSRNIYLLGSSFEDGPIPTPHENHGMAWLASGLLTFYRLTGYEPALRLGHKLAKFFPRHSGFVGPDGEFRTNHACRDVTQPGPMHFHANAMVRIAMLDAGLAAGDKELLDLVQQGYASGKAYGNTCMGYFPENFNPQTGIECTTCEICGVADMIYLARSMSVNGVADCWDDVDRWTRNMLAEGQLLETDWVNPYSEKAGTSIEHPYGERQDVAERCRGSWGGWIRPNDWQGSPTASIPACCVGNGARQLYMVWRDMIAHDGERNRLTAHLLLNRASPWADINSHIPYRGQVDVRLKRDCEVALRIPEWTTPQDCQCRINGSPTTPAWEGRYVVVAAKAQQEVSLHFPITERLEKLTINKDAGDEEFSSEFDLLVRGNDVVDVRPVDISASVESSASWLTPPVDADSVDVIPRGKRHPIFQKSHYRNETTRWQTVQRFVSDQVCELW